MGAYEITVLGLVQGVGFRPFVAEYAEKHGLVGSIKNAGGAVKLYIECDDVEIGKLCYHLRYNCPEGGRVDKVDVKPVQEVLYDEETAKITKELKEVAEKMEAIDQYEDEYLYDRGWMDPPRKKEKPKVEEEKKVETKKAEDFKSEVGASDEQGNVTEGVVLDEYGRELDDRFRIIKSEGYDEGVRYLPTDIATCDDCKRELLDPNNKRFRYPFISCSKCGPRYSIMKTVPYDRENSTMAPFTMCPDCKADYDEPGNRRRFDQNIGCAKCGPKLRYYENRLVDEVQMTQDEMLNKTVESLKAGKIGAIKDIGGFHFMCLPNREDSVARLRSFKDCIRRPFAIMFPDVETIKKYCYVSDKEEEVLTSNARPIVLLARREDPELEADFAPNVLMGSAHIGATLPFDPLQIILANEVGPLVITSGNRGGEPIITKDMDMIQFLPSIDGNDNIDDIDELKDGTDSSENISAVEYADDTIDEKETTYIGKKEEVDEDVVDFMLTNNRGILAPLEDSVAQVARIHTGNTKRRELQLVRRGRGYVPEAIVFDEDLPKETFAAGTDYQSSFALGKKNVCYLSEYYGNITNSSIYDVREKAINRLEELLGVNPKRFVGDLNPDYQSSKDADNKAMGTYIDGIPQRIVRRQHHAAHVLSVAAEHSLTGRLLGISYDGTGYGLDETIWGSEIFSCVLNDTIDEEVEKPDGTVETRPKILRSGALLPVKLMGGEQSARDIKSTLCGYIRAVEERQLVSPNVVEKVLRILGIDRADYGIVSACLRADIGIYYSACMGRLFDAVTALLSLKSRNTYAGESPIALEDAAMRSFRRNGITLKDIVPSELRMKVIEPKSEEEIYRMDQSILVADLMEKVVKIHDEIYDEKARDLAIEDLAFDFHKAIIDSTVYIADKVCGRDYIQHIALTGGSMYNRLLLDGIGSSLERLGYRTFINSKVPGGDGGISLGQMYSELI